jgi:hypothetical protein
MSEHRAWRQPAVMPSMIWTAVSGGESAHGQIIQEKQGSGPTGDDIVHAHGHQIDADGVVAVHENRDFDFGAHAVGGRNQHRVVIFLHVQVKQPGKPADFPDDPGAVGGFHQGANGLDKGVGLVDIHPRFFI